MEDQEISDRPANVLARKDLQEGLSDVCLCLLHQSIGTSGHEEPFHSISTFFIVFFCVHTAGTEGDYSS